MKDKSTINKTELHRYPNQAKLHHKYLLIYSILSASSAIIFTTTAQGADYTWTTGNYSATGYPITLTSADRLLTSTTSTKTLNSTLFTNNGTVNQLDSAIYFGGVNIATVINNAGTWDLKNDVGFNLSSTPANGSSGTFNNTGTLIKSAGSGSSIIASGLTFVNSGTLNAQTGIIDYQTLNPTFNSGTVQP